MEPFEINAGRFYLRTLREDRISDRHALASIEADPSLALPRSAADAERDWHANRAYTWAVCEQSNVDMVALLILTFSDATSAPAILRCYPTFGRSLTDVLPTDNFLDAVTVGDAMDTACATIERWAVYGLEREVVRG